MKKIIANQFGRRWLMWSFFSLLSMAAGLVVGIERDIRISCVLFTSISIATMDWGLGGPRVLLSLPFTSIHCQANRPSLLVDVCWCADVIICGF
jgi:hypothetical protein